MWHAKALSTLQQGPGRSTWSSHTIRKTPSASRSSVDPCTPLLSSSPPPPRRPTSIHSTSSTSKLDQQARPASTSQRADLARSIIYGREGDREQWEWTGAAFRRTTSWTRSRRRRLRGTRPPSSSRTPSRQTSACTRSQGARMHHGGGIARGEEGRSAERRDGAQREG